jgi:hypothetical protein
MSDIVNSEELDDFLFDHRENGCVAIKNDQGLNIAWKDRVTEDLILVEYASKEKD